MQQPENAATQKPENTATQKRKLNTDRCRNPKQHRTATQKTQADQPEKKKKKKTHNINPENTNPQQKIFRDGIWKKKKKTKEEDGEQEIES